MTTREIPHLTKSRYMTGLQCDRKLWRDCHGPAKISEPNAGSIADIGNRIGVMAQNLFPGGELVAEQAFEHDKAVEHTSALIAEETVSAIFEAAIEHDGIRVRVDILERLDGGAWGLREVKSGKSGSKIKLGYLDDTAVQYHVLAGSGLNISSAELILVNKDYVHEQKNIDYAKYFVREDILSLVLQKLDKVSQNLAEQKSVLRLTSAPFVEPYKSMCKRCDYWLDCTKDKPVDWVQRLHGIKYKKVLNLKGKGIVSIRDLSGESGLSHIQEIERQVIISGEQYISPEIWKPLKEFRPPAYYLDFEYFDMKIPPFLETKMGERLPFQWSIHHVESAEELDRLDDLKQPVHFEYLSDGQSDFRRECAEGLLKVLGQSDEPIIVYEMAAEKSAIESLARSVPDLTDELLALLPRLRDLIVVVRSYTCLPAYFPNNYALSTTTYSIKNTATALCPQFKYSELGGVSDGLAAGEAFFRIMTGEFKNGETVATLSTELLEYCQYDTLAMVKVHRAVIRLANALPLQANIDG